MSKKLNEKGWFYLALGCILISLLSLFLPIFQSYGMNFNIIDEIYYSVLEKIKKILAL